MMLDFGKKKTPLVKRNAFFELGNILQDYGKSGDKAKTLRRLSIQEINFEKLQRRQAAELFGLMRKQIKKRK